MTLVYVIMVPIRLDREGLLYCYLVILVSFLFQLNLNHVCMFQSVLWGILMGLALHLGRTDIVTTLSLQNIIRIFSYLNPFMSLI